jgi:hypothetical protein
VILVLVGDNKMTDRQKELKNKHGTPNEFEEAVWKAWMQLFIKFEEATAAISKYRDEWNSAGEEIG